MNALFTELLTTALGEKANALAEVAARANNATFFIIAMVLFNL